MSAPRVLVDLAAVTHNTRALVDPLADRGIAVTGVVKAVLGLPMVARAMLSGGVTGLADSRVENLERLRAAGVAADLTLTRSPMLSQVARAVRVAHHSLNSDPGIVAALSAAALDRGLVHGIVLMVELGDLREGLMAADVVDAARAVIALPGVRLHGLGTNLACRSGVVPDQSKMDQLSDVVEQVERACTTTVGVVSGGNSANLEWALGDGETGRINQLRLGEAILLGVEPLHRTALPGLRTDAFTLVAEVIEAGRKPARPWGDTAQAAFGLAPPATGSGEINQLVIALGRQDSELDSLVPPAGVRVLAMSSDHLVVDAGDHALGAGDEVTFGVGYGALLRAMTSPYVGTATAPGETTSPLRLSLGRHGAGDVLDGGWWPYSRDLATELTALLNGFPPGLGAVVRADYSSPDWDLAPGAAVVDDSEVEVRPRPDGHSHLVDLWLTDGSVLHVLVVPPALSAYQGAEALLAAASRGNAHTARALLDTVTEFPDPDPDDRWATPATFGHPVR